MRALYDSTENLSAKYSKPERPVQDKAGRQIPGKEQQRKRWLEHFEELLNRLVSPNPPDISSTSCSTAQHHYSEN